jgi:hypothetical protein
VKHYLLIFDRSAGSIRSLECFHDEKAALRARFGAERRYRGEQSVEVVVLTADSHSSLERTHARYFHPIGTLAERGARALPKLTGEVGV